MKVLHVNNNFKSVGGSEQYLFNICYELSKLGYKNVVLYGASDVGDSRNTVKKFYHVPFLDDFDNSRNSELEDQIHSILITEKPDLVYLHNIHNPKVADILVHRLPVVKYVHDHEMYCPKKVRMVNGRPCPNNADLICFVNAFRADGFRCMGQRRLLSIAKKTKLMILNTHVHKKIHRYVVASHHMKNNLTNRGYAANRITVIPYFTESPDDLAIKKKEKNFLFVGRLIPEKGLDVLIDTLTLLREKFRLTIIGEGIPGYMNHLQEQIIKNNLNENIEFTGWVDNKKLGQYYSKAAFLVCPSIWPEPFGIVGIEAMAHGLPVIAFNVGGISEWLKDQKTGFLIEHGDMRAFAEKMDLLLGNETIRAELGRNAHEETATLYNKYTHIHKLISLFNEVVHTEK
jgi:glycosyltransferase involved in cell wall biosynthesis